MPRDPSRQSEVLPLGNDDEVDERQGQDGEENPPNPEHLQQPQDPLQQQEPQQPAGAQQQIGTQPSIAQQVGSGQVAGTPTGSVTTGVSVNSMAAAKPTVTLSPYSGNPIGTRLSGGGTEDFTPENWVRRVEIIANSAGWNSKQKASNAALALLPNTPAERWYAYHGQGGQLDEWEDFKAALIKEFAPPPTVMEKVAMFRSMKLDKAERTADYTNKLHLKFAKFEDGLQHIWAGPSYADEATDDKLKKRRERVVQDVIEHLKMIMFAAGLPDGYVAEITKRKAASLPEMLEICKLAEAAQAATAAKQKPISATGVEEHPTPTSKEEIAEMVAAIMKGNAKEAKTKQEAQKKQRDTSKATCYYCFKVGHIVPQCPTKKEDRAKNVYKLTAKDPPLTKEQWEEQKMWRGRQTQAQQQGVTSAAARASPSTPRPPATRDWWSEFAQEN